MKKNNSTYICNQIRYMKIFKSLAFIGAFLFFLSACAPKKDVVYFTGIDTLQVANSNLNYTPVFKPDDQLTISVSALDLEAALPFNLPVASFNTNGTSVAGNQQLQSYLIAKDGTIEFPQLGTMQMAGLTRLQAITMLKEKLKPFLVDPVVNITLVNFKVTVLGEVKKPGTYAVKSERISVLEAIGLAGDLTIHGTRQNALLIRETSEGKVYERIDLSTTDLFNSSYYYLQQNDVLYIEPNKPKVNSSATSSTTGVWISVTSLLITVITLIVK